jgi:hypothetical protein
MGTIVGSCAERPVTSSSPDDHPALLIRICRAACLCYREVWRVLYPILYGSERGDSISVTDTDGVQSLGHGTTLITRG